MKALKLAVAAQTASFRYPRVQVGRQPSFDMPPPATIYGHLAGVIGEWFDPEGLEFAYVFEHAGRADDLETIHPIAKGSGKATLARRGWPHAVNVQCETNIQRRQFLLKPRLTLYLKSREETKLNQFRNAFRNPYFSYILGRSQDLATCHSAEIVDLATSADAFFENTLVPFDWRPSVLPGITVLLPAAIDYSRGRLSVQERYLQITKPLLRVFPRCEDLIDREKLPSEFLVDSADTRTISGHVLARGLHFWPVRGPGAVA
ncbi:MAG TPA: type I-B CRISPR-associated protein Cas5b [Terriglobales bacterium]|nr:type I-B CRISPR-associated protein Cas5b [Terriglobales bacterium]